MLDFGRNVSFGGRVTSQLVRHNDPGRFGSTAEQTREETFGCIRAAVFLYQEVKHDPMLVDSSPKIMGLAPDALVAHGHAPCRQDQLDVPQAQAESVIQPDRMGDDLRRKTEASGRVLGLEHLLNMP